MKSITSGVFVRRMVKCLAPLLPILEFSDFPDCFRGYSFLISRVDTLD